MRAQFDGICAECGHRVHEGEPIIVHDDGWQHADCETTRRPENPVCDVCWLTHPAGACER